MERHRKKYSPEFKAKVALAAAKGQKTRVQAMRRLLRKAVGSVPGTFAEFTEPIQ